MWGALRSFIHSSIHGLIERQPEVRASRSRVEQDRVYPQADSVVEEVRQGSAREDKSSGVMSPEKADRGESFSWGDQLG